LLYSFALPVDWHCRVRNNCLVVSQYLLNARVETRFLSDGHPGFAPYVRSFLAPNESLCLKPVPNGRVFIDVLLFAFRITEPSREVVTLCSATRMTLMELLFICHLELLSFLL
jgi:hypothetical protein